MRIPLAILCCVGCLTAVDSLGASKLNPYSQVWPDGATAVGNGRANEQAKQPPKPKPSFKISKETTYVLGPIDKDGYIDYETALNKRLSEGVTPENNANVLLWQAFGPRAEILSEDPPRYFPEQAACLPPDEERLLALQRRRQR